MNKLINGQLEMDSSKPRGKLSEKRVKSSLGLVERQVLKSPRLSQFNVSLEKQEDRSSQKAPCTE